MKNYLRSKLDEHLWSLAHKSDLDNLYSQFAALLEVKGLVGANVPLGPLRVWALSPDAMTLVLREVADRKAPNVVEFGAGESTIAIAAVLRNAGAGSLTTIEHDDRFAAVIRERLERCDLADRVEVRTVLSREYETYKGFPRFISYDLSGLELEFDVALIDGPIVGQFGSNTRAVPTDWCLERLADKAAAYLDDAARPGEAEIIAAVKRDRPGLMAELIETEKGLCKFSLRAR